MNVSGQFYEDLFQALDKEQVSSLVFLKTCNRLEIYGYGNVKHTKATFLRLFPFQMDATKLICRSGKPAIQHLFKVASGLDSQLVGDLEILGQFKKAFKEAKQKNRISGYMERLANACIQSAKKIRSNTHLTSGTTSLSYAAIRLLSEKKLIEDASILVVGLGKFGKGIAKNIHNYFPKHSLTLCNRTLTKSTQLADELNCNTLPFEKLLDEISQYDVIISALEAPGFKIQRQHLSAGRGKKIIIDLCMPSFFHSDVTTEEKIEVFSIEDAATIINNSLEERKTSIPLANNIMEQHIHEFTEWSRFYEKSSSIKVWKSTVEMASRDCPHFETIEEKEQQTLLNKSVSQFVHFIKKQTAYTDKENKLVADFMQASRVSCALSCTVHQTVQRKICTACPNH